jgi:hypothetical protein
LFDTIVETHPTETKRDRRQSDSEHARTHTETERRRDLEEVERERAVGESKMQKWVAGLLGVNQMEFMEGMLWVGREKGKEKNNQ